MKEKKVVPRGIKIIGGIFILMGIIFAISFPLLLFAISFAGESSFIFYLAFLLIPVSIFFIYLGVNLKKGKNWARNVTLKISFIYFVLNILLMFSYGFPSWIRIILTFLRFLEPLGLILAIPFISNIIASVVYGAIFGYLYETRN